MAQAAPISGAERYQSLDILRGVAVLGILAVNIWFMALPSWFYANANALGPLEGSDKLIWSALHIFVHMKFVTLFSLMFGAGIALMAERSGASLHKRRMMWLLLFGLIHAYLIWPGDILVLYAVCGLILTGARTWGTARLVSVGLILILIGGLLNMGLNLAMAAMGPDLLAEEWSPDKALIAEQIRLRGEGSWLKNVLWNIGSALEIQLGGLLVFTWRTVGVMMLGMAAFRWGVLTAARGSLTYLLMIVVGLGLGTALSWQSIVVREAADWDFTATMAIGESYSYVGSLFSAAGWIGLVMLFAKAPFLGIFKTMFAATGRMAFTNYIAQSLIVTTFMYGYGFGMFGAFTVTQLFMLTLIIWAAQLIWSPLWLMLFRQGPLEWLWRSLTYGRAA